jgi:hypothetical protein
MNSANAQQQLSNTEHSSKLKKFEFLKDINDEPNVDVERIRVETRELKINHEWFGPLWKVAKQWKAGELEQEVERRVEEQKRRMQREMIEQKFLQHYSAPIEAVTDKLIELVWNWDSPESTMRALNAVEVSLSGNGSK